MMNLHHGLLPGRPTASGRTNVRAGAARLPQPLAGSLLVAAVLSARSPSQSGATAADILAKVEAATAESGARAKTGNVVLRGKVTAAGMEGAGTFEECYAADGRVLYTMNWAGMGTTTQGTDGKVAWSTDPAMGVIVKEGDENGPVLRMFAICRRAPWTLHYVKGEVVGKKALDGREHIELRMTPHAGATETWFVNSETFALARADLALPDPLGGTIPMRFLFSDWKRVDGILYPHCKRQVVGHYVIEFRIDAIEHPATIAAERLAPPPAVAEAIADPKRRMQAAPKQSGACEIKEVQSQHTASVRLEVAADEISKTLAIVLPEVMQHLTAVGEVPAGPPFTRYHSITGGRIDLEAGIPVKKAVAGEGRVQPSTLPGGRAAVTWHFGDYHELAKTHKVLEEWMQRQSVRARGPVWEVYWTDPGIEPDMKKWRTQIVWPVE